MILNYPSKSQKYSQTEYRKYLSSTMYPTQDTTYLNLLVPITFRDEKNEDTVYRLEYSESLSNYKMNTITVFLVLRCDAEYPYKAILINSSGSVLVTTTTNLKAIVTPTSFSGIQNRFQESTTFFNRKYAPFTYEDDYDPSSDYVESIKVQNKAFIGLEGYTEYENELVTSDTISDREDQSIEQEEPNYRDVEQRFEDIVAVYPELESTTYMNKESITSFPYSHYIHDKNYIDKPFATKNSAVIIRADVNNDECVFMERVEDEDGNTVLRFVTGDEVYFYYESTTQFNKTYEYDIMDILNEIIEGNIQS